MELIILYLWLKLGIIQNGFIVLGVILLLVLVFSSIFISESPGRDMSAVPWKRLVLGIAFCFSFAGLLPNQKETAVLVGGYYAIKMVESTEAQKVMGILRKKANELLDQELQK